MSKEKIDCLHYDDEFGCCRWFSDWSQDMPILQPCLESPCEHYRKKKRECEFCKEGDEKCGTCEWFMKGTDGCATYSDMEHCVRYKPVNYCFMCGRKLRRKNEQREAD